MRATSWVIACAASLSSWPVPLQAETPLYAGRGDNCSFKSAPDRFLSAHSRARKELFERGHKFERALARTGESHTVDAATVPQRNFVDEEIFRRLTREGVRSAKLSTDEEFLRRIYLDLTGRIPAPEQVRAFSSDTDPGKRDSVIDQLLSSAEFTDKWTMWFGDLLQNNASASNVNLQANGRNAFHNWIRHSVDSGKSIKDIAYEAVVGGGNNYRDENATANFYVKARTPGGPAQDTYDTMLLKTASAFLGLAYYDCLLCHNGRGHLDQLSLWGRSGTRTDAWRMAAFFSRTRLSQPYNRVVERTDFYYNSWEVADVDAGQYVLNTTFGNRPNRAPIAGTLRNLQPEYRETGAKPESGENWRGAFAENMVKDPMFARNFANRLWKAMFNLGLVDPVDTMDPARLDPNAELPAGWSLQATHPELLERLAAFFVASNYSLRETLRQLAQSSAYQLSSRYDSDWNIEYVPLFARHYVRRLEGEEVHDAVQTATGILGSYPITGWPAPVSWAMQLPETTEPRDRVTAFLNHFVRGNRDTQQRHQAGSIQQQLAMMNDAFVNNRIRIAASPTLQAAAQLGASKEIVEQLFLLFLSRQPGAGELQTAVAHLERAGADARSRDMAIEDVAWACVNKFDFLFSY